MQWKSRVSLDGTLRTDKLLAETVLWGERCLTRTSSWRTDEPAHSDLFCPHCYVNSYSLVRVIILTSSYFELASHEPY